MASYYDTCSLGLKLVIANQCAYPHITHMSPEVFKGMTRVYYDNLAVCSGFDHWEVICCNECTPHCHS